MNFIASVAWIPRGVAKSVPDQVALTADEIRELFAQQRTGEPDEEPQSDSDDEKTSKKVKEEDEEWAEDEEGEGEDGEEAGGSGLTVSSLSQFPSNADDPYITVKDEDDEDSETEDFQIKPGDNLLAVGHVDEDANILEIYVYNEENDDFYIHHDMLLPSYPLALEWLNHQPGQTEEAGNYLAVGSMDDVIQIWDVDVVNALEPAYELKSRKKRKKTNRAAVAGHSDAVLCLSWNRLAPHVLASGSADESVILWDLDQLAPSTVLSDFADKVQTIQWRPEHAQQILAGSVDKIVSLVDCRLKKAKSTKWNVSGEVERVAWSRKDSSYFYVTDDLGGLYVFDTRQTEEHVFHVAAHEKAVSGLAESWQVPGCLLTASEDKLVKVWDADPANGAPTLVCSHKMKMGELQFAAFSPNSPFVVALAGDNSDRNLKVVSLLGFSDEIGKRFESRVPQELTIKAEADSYEKEKNVSQKDRKQGKSPKLNVPRQEKQPPGKGRRRATDRSKNWKKQSRVPGNKYVDKSGKKKFFKVGKKKG